MKNLECITLFVEDLAASKKFYLEIFDHEVCGKLKTLGVQLLNGPQDRHWGRRTAAFADPAGHVWELAHEI